MSLMWILVVVLAVAAVWTVVVLLGVHGPTHMRGEAGEPHRLEREPGEE